MNKYSTTYANEIVKLVGALIIIFDVSPEVAEAIEVAIGSLLVLAAACWTLYQRWKSGQENRAGAINIFGVRK